jgi:hypothetical protein
MRRDRPARYVRSAVWGSGCVRGNTASGGSLLRREPTTADAKRVSSSLRRLRHSARSSKPGGWEPVAACHAAAAPRWATRRDTAAPTPKEIDQMSASRQATLRDAGFSGGSWWRLTRQRAVIPLRHAAAAAAPEANANISHRRRCTPRSFPRQHVRQPVQRGRPQGGAGGKVDHDVSPGAVEVGCEPAT